MLKLTTLGGSRIDRCRWGGGMGSDNIVDLSGWEAVFGRLSEIQSRSECLVDSSWNEDCKMEHLCVIFKVREILSSHLQMVSCLEVSQLKFYIGVSSVLFVLESQAISSFMISPRL
jgi:hypothetical protein